MIQLTLALKMTTSSQVVKMPVTVNNNPIQGYTYEHNHVSPTDKLFFFYCFQSVGGLQIIDTISSRTYELDNLAQVFVYSSELSPFIHQSKRWPIWLNNNKQRLYKESIWSHNYGNLYGNFCNKRQRNCSEKKRDINDKENRCQCVSNNILTTYRNVL